MAAVVGVAFSSDGSMVASSSCDGILQFWDLTTDERFRKFGGPVDGIWRIAYSPDGKLVAIQSGESIRLRDTMTNTVIHDFIPHNSLSNGVVFSPDSKLIAMGDGSGTLIRDVVSGEICRLQEPTIMPKDAMCTAFSPDGRFLATGHHQRICIWEPA